MKAAHAADQSWVEIVRASRWHATAGAAHRRVKARPSVLVLMALTLVASTASFWLIGSTNTPVSAESTSSAPTAPMPAVPGAASAYLGAFVDPAGTALTSNDPTGGTASLSAELAALPAFDTQVGHAPSILSTFQQWGQPVDQAGLARVAATGAIPMVTWDCGDADASVAAGTDDAAVTAEARGLAATNVPILFRWFPDPNASNPAATASCLGTAGPSGYIAAFTHIRRLFEAAGATDVAFVWSIDTSSGADPNLDRYYPGPGVVDWIGADGTVSANDAASDAAFTSEFGSWYANFASAGKPMLVSSVGVAAGSQSAYLGQVVPGLTGQFPRIKGFVYADAPNPATGASDQLDAAGAPAFGQMAGASWFNPVRSGTVTTVSSPHSPVPSGALVSLHAAVDAPDNSGSVTFLDGGAAIQGCVFVPIVNSPVCQTSELGVGSHEIVAAYSGDAAFAPSSSAQTSVTVVASGKSGPATASPSAAGGLKASVMGGSATAAGSAAGAADTSGPPVPATGTAYLGSFVDPSGTSLQSQNPTGGIASLPGELASLPDVEQGLARPLSIVPIYLNWTDALTVTALDQVAATGAIPMVTWTCSGTDANVAAGAEDSQINQEAQKLAQFGRPVFLRWFPDPNAPSAAATACLGGGGAAGYVAAFEHIHDVMVADGDTNVSFVWSVDTTTPNDDPAWSSYYPGPAYVDWIGADAVATSSQTANIGSDFGSWYSTFSGQKPLMISQTGAVPSLQPSYIQQLSSVPGFFPAIRAVVYFDAPDVVTGNHYELPASSPGLQQFDALSELPSFQPARAGTTTSVAASANPIAAGEVVHVTAQVAGSDGGGYLTFTEGGTTIPACDAVPLTPTDSCDTSTLPEGTNQIDVAYSGDAVSGPSTSQFELVVSAAEQTVGPPSIPAPGQTYLGAWVRPSVSHTVLPLPAAILEELQNLPSFNAGLARPLSIVHMYQSWNNPASVGQIQRVLAGGSIPMIDWRCGDTDANIIAGKDDAQITAEAQRLAAFKAPIFLRWYYEPNFPFSVNYATCISSLGPAGYAAAFRHIHDLFVAAGATNVAFVFCLATAVNTDPDVYQYYPGSAYVDWIAADGYVRKPIPAPTAFTDHFAAWYAQFAPLGKPMMVAETASWSGGQAAYLQQIEKAVSLTGSFPLLKAVMYFDAPGHEGQNTYPLDSSGMQTFQSLSAQPAFQPSRATSSLAADVSPSVATAGHRVRLSAQVSNSDFGGSVSFYVNGTPVLGCQSIPVAVSSACGTTDLPAGVNQVSAVYSGDAEVSGSAATAVGKVRSSSAGTGSGLGSLQGVPTLFPQFRGTPDIGGLAALAGQRKAALFSFETTLSLPDYGGSHPGGSGTDPIGWLKDPLHLGGGASAVLVPVGGVLLLLLAAYMGTTWMQDRRRQRAGLSAALIGESAAQGGSDPLKAEEPASKP